MSSVPFLCIMQIICELSESSNDLYSCSLVNRMWCECAIAYLWQTPFRWSGRKACRMLVKFLRFLPKECFEDLEDIVDMHPPLESEQSIFNYLNFVRTIKVLDCIHATEYYLSHH